MRVLLVASRSLEKEIEVPVPIIRFHQAGVRASHFV